MKKIIAFVILLSGTTLSPIHAALPPFYQSTKELIAILENKQLEEKLSSGESIESVTRNEKGYLFVTNQHNLQVDVRYTPNVQPGPVQFDLYFHAAQEI